MFINKNFYYARNGVALTKVGKMCNFVSPELRIKSNRYYLSDKVFAIFLQRVLSTFILA
jgi:hypothetical protein